MNLLGQPPLLLPIDDGLAEAGPTMRVHAMPHVDAHPTTPRMRPKLLRQSALDCPMHNTVTFPLRPAPRPGVP